MSAPDIISSEECRHIARACLGTDDFKDVTAEIKPLEGAPAGFMSEHFRIRLQVQLHNNQVREFKFFAKTVPRKVPLHKAYVEDSGAYFKETTFYSKVMPGLEKYFVKDKIFTNEKDLFKNHRWGPQCYLTRPDIIVLYDLSVNDFKLCNNRELMNIRQCEVVIREMASFHAATVILEEKHAQVSGKFSSITELYPVVFDESIISSLADDDSKGWFISGVKSLLPLVDLLPKYKDSPELRSTIRSKITDVLNRYGMLVAASNKYRNVVCHGDLWANNILLQYNEKGDPVEARFVDFQLVRYTPPAHDFMCFLYLNTDKSFRNLQYDKLLRVYYDAFSSELRRNSLEPDRLLPWTEFIDSCSYLKEMALITTVLYFQMTLLKGEITTPIFENPHDFNRFMLTDRSAEVCASFQTDEVYRTRLNEPMEELIECYVLS